MTRSTIWLLLGICLVVPTSVGCGSGSGFGGGGDGDLAPSIVAAIAAPQTTIHVGDDVSFAVTATDPEGDALTLYLLNPPPGAEFARATGVGTASRTFRWLVDEIPEQRLRLRFRAVDAGGAVGDAVVVLHSHGFVRSRVICCDVTGDGVLDVVARAHLADIGAVDDGAIYVFAGATTPAGAPTATLSVPGAAASSELADSIGAARLVCCDVTGDGIDDIIAGAPRADTPSVDAGAVYVFRGGGTLTGSVTPTATLTVPGASTGDMLAKNGLRCCDVTGDGTLDVIAWSDRVDIGVVDAGAVYVWSGGTGLTGTPFPAAALRRPVPIANDTFSSGGVICCDVTNDGHDDLIVVSPFANTAVASDAGAIDVWAGGPAFTGGPATAILQRSSPVPNDRLGSPGVRCCDVMGTGRLDIVVGAWHAFAGGVGSAGAIFVWDGDALSGAPAPSTTLRRTAPFSGDLFGEFCCCDVTGDGRADVIGSGAFANAGGVDDVGEVVVWKGGLPAGTPTPTATLRIPTPSVGDRLSDADVPVRCCDVTGDGVNDLVVPARLYDGIGTDQGAVFIWAGGATLTNVAAPRARLRKPGPSSGAEFGGGEGFPMCCDVTGDGVRDVIVAAPKALVGIVSGAGAVFVFQGGSTLVGDASALARLMRPVPVRDDEMGADRALCCDVSGDGVRDIIVAGQRFDTAGVTDAGQLLVWNGGASLTGAPAPTATLQATGRIADDRVPFYATCCDLDGDGLLDVLGTAALTDVAFVANAGVGLFWKGGTLNGTPAPAVLRRTTLFVDDFFFGFTPPQFCDVTGDGHADLLALSPDADLGAVANVGVIGFWRGGTAPTTHPAVELAVPGATAGDRLGR